MPKHTITLNVEVTDINDLLNGLWEQDHWWGKDADREILKAQLKAERDRIEKAN